MPLKLRKPAVRNPIIYERNEAGVDVILAYSATSAKPRETKLCLTAAGHVHGVGESAGFCPP